MAIISPGIGSGIDINSLVSQLVELQSGPQLQRLDVREGRLQARLSAFGTVQGALSTLQTSLNGLKTPEAFQARSVKTADGGILNASAGVTAATGVHSISVDELARGQRLTTNPAVEGARFTSVSDPVGTGTLTFKFGTTDYDPETGVYSSFTPNADTTDKIVQISDGSLEGIRNAINEAGIGVKASIVFDGEHYRLVMSTEDTGAANSVQIVAEDDDGNHSDAAGLSLLAFNGDAAHLTQTQAAQDTVGLMVDGIAVTSAGNTLRGTVEGLTINLTAPGSTTVTVEVDSEKIEKAILNFVESYNTLRETINGFSSFDAATGQAGILNGDSVLRSIDTQLSRVMTHIAGDADSPFRQLADIGISRDPSNGALLLDSDRLQNAIQQDSGAISAMFAGAGGYAESLDNVLSNLVGGNGLVRNVTEGITGRIRDISDQRLAVQQRAIAFEERTRAQFTAMDGLVSQLRSTSDFLTRQLESLPTIGQGRSRR